MSRSVEDCLRTRRSVRRFTGEAVERGTVEALLELAVLAPSASNLQPWKFVIADDPALVQKIKSFSPGISGQPPCVITFCLDAALLPQREDGAPDTECAVLDLAMAAENLMLAAADRGLGTCVIKSFHPALVRRILRLPDRLLPEFLVILGHPAQTPDMPKRRPVGELIRYNLEEGAF
ncbi:MAG: nitroreductase family protein [Oscillibacter sp.]|nr:nitroreductase family protein [Oscillibacter sp.]